MANERERERERAGFEDPNPNPWGRGPGNWVNRTLYIRDNLDILRGMNSDTVDLIYLDPPFNSNKTYEAPIGSQAAGAAFKDSWHLSDVDLAWHGEIAEKNQGLYDVIAASRTAHGEGMMSYLVMMAARIIELERVLKPTGSIYLHCDPTASHYLKMVMDSVFGKAQFRNEVIWSYSGGGVPKKDFARKHDTILRYTGPGDYTFHPQFRPYKEGVTTHSGGAPVPL